MRQRLMLCLGAALAALIPASAYAAGAASAGEAAKVDGLVGTANKREPSIYDWASALSAVETKAPPGHGVGTTLPAGCP